MLRRRWIELAVPTIIAVLSFLHARATGALVTSRAAPESIAPFADARAALEAHDGDLRSTRLVYLVVKDGRRVELESVTR